MGQVKVLNEGLMRRHSSKIAGTQFSSLAFPPKLGGKKLWVRERNFSPGFFTLKTPSIFHPMPNKGKPTFPLHFPPIFFTPPKIHPTKHSVNFTHTHKAVSTLLHNWFGFGLAVIDCWQKLVCFGPLLLVQYIVIQIGAHMNLRIIWMAKKVG